MFFEHFKTSELFPGCDKDEVFECVTGGHFDNLLILFCVLDDLRSYLDYPIKVTSTYRGIEHNKKVGGSSTSQHLIAGAIDFVVPSVPFQTLEYYVREFFQKSALERFVGQVIFYRKRKFIHIGMRTPSHPNLIYYYNEKGDN